MSSPDTLQAEPVLVSGLFAARRLSLALVRAETPGAAEDARESEVVLAARQMRGVLAPSHDSLVGVECFLPVALNHVAGALPGEARGRSGNAWHRIG